MSFPDPPWWVFQYFLNQKSEKLKGKICQSRQSCQELLQAKVMACVGHQTNHKVSGFCQVSIYFQHHQHVEWCGDVTSQWFHMEIPPVNHHHAVSPILADSKSLAETENLNQPNLTRPSPASREQTHTQIYDTKHSTSPTEVGCIKKKNLDPYRGPLRCIRIKGNPWSLVSSSRDCTDQGFITTRSTSGPFLKSPQHSTEGVNMKAKRRKAMQICLLKKTKYIPSIAKKSNFWCLAF